MNDYKSPLFYEKKPSAANAPNVSNVIKRREIDPLLTDAAFVADSYKKAADCMVSVSVLDKNGLPLDKSEKAGEQSASPSFCNMCKKHDSEPCKRLHIDGMSKAQDAGGAYIYMCDAGFIYWTSLIYSGGRHIGALNAGNVLCAKRKESIERLYAMKEAQITEGDTLKCLSKVAEKNYEEIKALAQMLEFCAEQLSTASSNKEAANMQKKRSLKVNDSDQHLNKERLLFAALRRGDRDTGRKLLRELLGSIVISSPDNFDFIQLRAIELVVLLSREAWNTESENNATECKDSLEVNNRSIKRIQEAKNIAELHEALYSVIDRMGGKIFSFQGMRHASALRKAERYIWENYTRKVSLKEIANKSGLSSSYFSSIFKEEMGENLSSYLNRLRSEKAALLLMESDMSLREIAFACGFEDQSWFSKIFKIYAGTSPGKYREQSFGALSGLKELSIGETKAAKEAY